MFSLPLSHFALRIPLIILLLAFAGWAMMTGMAGIYQFQANSYFELWQQQRAKNSNYNIEEHTYRDVLALYQQSVKLTPYNGDYWTGLADMQMWYLANTANLPSMQQQLIKDSVFHAYHTALSQRPTWAYSYANFAVIKARFGEIDTEMMQALHKANQLGQREADVIHITIQLGLILWDKLDKSTQQLVANAIDRSMTWQLNDSLNNKERIFALSLVGVYHKEYEICALLSPKGKESSNMCF